MLVSAHGIAFFSENVLAEKKRNREAPVKMKAALLMFKDSRTTELVDVTPAHFRYVSSREFLQEIVPTYKSSSVCI